jgi:hypothetical protein
VNQPVTVAYAAKLSSRTAVETAELYADTPICRTSSGIVVWLWSDWKSQAISPPSSFCWSTHCHHTRAPPPIHHRRLSLRCGETFDWPRGHLMWQIPHLVAIAFGRLAREVREDVVEALRAAVARAPLLGRSLQQQGWHAARSCAGGEGGARHAVRRVRLSAALLAAR